MVTEPRGALTCRSLTLAILADSGPFRGLLFTILGPRAIFWLLKPKVRLRVVYQHSPFWPILARFMGYYSLIWGCGAIFRVTGPQCAITCRSLTLTVLADLGPFRALLLKVLGSRSDFYGC